MRTSFPFSLSRVALLVMALLLVPAVIGPAMALDLEQAKAAGQVGERPDGYIGAVTGGAEVAALVKRINDARRSAYRKIAKSNKAPVASVEQLAGGKLTKRAAAAGHFVMDGSGKWVRK